MVHIYSAYPAVRARTVEDSKEVLMSLIIIIMHDIILIIDTKPCEKMPA